MTEIESELGSTSFQTGNKREVYTVEDASNPPAQDQQIPQRVPRQAPQQMPQNRFETPRAAGEGRSFASQPQPQVLSNEDRRNLEDMRQTGRGLTVEAKKRVEFLIGLGKVTDEFEIDGVNFSIRTLSTGEIKEIAKTVSLQEMSAAELGFELRTQTLARSVYQINGYLLAEVIGDDSMEARLALFDSLSDSVAAYIHDKYKIITEKAQNQYAVKTEEDVKEVADAIKKS